MLNLEGSGYGGASGRVTGEPSAASCRTVPSTLTVGSHLSKLSSENGFDGASFEGNIKTLTTPRPDKPKDEWTNKTIELFWERIKQDPSKNTEGDKLDLRKKEHREMIKQASKENFISIEEQEREKKKKEYQAKTMKEKRENKERKK